MDLPLESGASSFAQDATASKIASPSNNSTSVPAQETEEDASTTGHSGLVVHDGITCDGETCPPSTDLRYITGVRYNCTRCVNTDFCSSCEPKHDPEHPRVAYRMPKPRMSLPDLQSPNKDETESSPSVSSVGDSLEDTNNEEDKNYQSMIDRLKDDCTKDEQKLLGNIADLGKITTS